MTRRRWIADDWDNTSALLKGDQADHLIRVLRAQTGMECDMVAGDRVWRAVISGISGDAVRFTLLSEVEAVPALPVTLLLSVSSSTVWSGSSRRRRSWAPRGLFR
jgi:16S rRNA (uracil1498-N3)-methyltransferase